MPLECLANTTMLAITVARILEMKMSALGVKGASDFKSRWKKMPPCCSVWIFGMILVDKHSRHVSPHTAIVSRAHCDYSKRYCVKTLVLGNQNELEVDSLRSHLCIWCVLRILCMAKHSRHIPLAYL